MALSKKWIRSLQSSDPTQDSERVFARNMSALQAKDISLYHKIASLPHDPSYELYRQKPKDLYNLLLKNHNSHDAIHPYYDPTDILASVEHSLSKHDTRNRRFIILCGIGLGYELLTFLNQYSWKTFSQTLLVIEKDPHIFKTCLESIDLSDLIADPNISFMVGHAAPDFKTAFLDYISPIPRLALLKSICVILPDPCLRTDSPYYVDIVKAIKASSVYMMRFLGNSPEDSIIGERHMFRNLKSILENPGITLLYGKFSGKPAIVCASGPSLTAELPLLKTLQDQVLILSAESTFWALIAHGIRPHIICTLERVVRPTGYFDKFSHDDVKDTYLAAVPVVPPNMYESYLGPKINVYRNFNHFHWLPFDKGILDIKQSSASMAFKLAHILGCSPIILLGQDLSFDRDTHLTHIAEHHFGANQTQYHEQESIEVPANDGQTALTSPIWLDFLRGYEVDVRAYGGDVINCSAKGAYIEGTRYMPFNQAADQYLKNPYAPLPIIRKALAPFTKDTIHKDLILLIDKIDTALPDLSALAEACAEGLRLIEECAELFSEALSDINSGAHSDFTASASGRQSLSKYLDKISALKNRLYASDTYQMIVLHVMQSFIVAFEMNLNEDYLELNSEDIMILHTILKHQEYFSTHATFIDKITKELEEAQGGITSSLAPADPVENKSPDQIDPDGYLAEVAGSYEDQDFHPYYSSPYPDPSQPDLPHPTPGETHP
ncbi:MAG: DUF115 domain-containing protein [Peptococcaceae bacterium]|nr:DUF115 domain-containing protein [Peptococcaceae bacterium]